MKVPSSRSAAFPWLDGQPTHLPCHPGDITPSVLLPGDPDRVTKVASVLNDVVDLGRRREFQMARARWQGTPVTICSTGIGGPSTEIAVVELANLGMTTGIRVGGMGAIDPAIPLGSFVIVDRALRNTGTSRIYAPFEGDLRASAAVIDALERAARALKLPHRRGAIFTTDSYYWGQERLARPDDDPGEVPTRGLIARLAAGGIAGMDMECETLFAVGGALDIKVGAVLAVHGNRATDEWLEDYEETQHNLIRLAATAIAILESPHSSSGEIP
ncbi:nucleoside phosphorylase [Microvirga antarctica]|uniref:nucleoside phosphorylase n=1 Tax=Microvirga antarctica TaxID=2819233 RepID=UPI001B3157F2|nr:nucleoside phosphorylase [Microvirga antarctica]